MKFLNSSELKVYELFPSLWRHESDLALALALTLTLALWNHSISGIQHHTSGIKTDHQNGGYKTQTILTDVRAPCALWPILVPRGRAPFGQHQESRSLAFKARGRDS